MNDNRLMQQYKKQNRYIRGLTDAVLAVKEEVGKVKKDVTVIKENTKKDRQVSDG